MLNELDLAVLSVDLPEHGLSAGDLGTVVLVHGREGYEVEFATLEGRTLAMLSLGRDQVRAADASEIAHARAVG